MNHPLYETIFPSAPERRFFVWYRRLFSLAEIESATVLQFLFGALLLSFFVCFSEWVNDPSISVSSYLNNSYRCWPYFQDCGRWYFLSSLPTGYSQTLWYMALFGIMLLICYLMYRKEWTLAHMLMVILWIWTVLVMFILTRKLVANYNYYIVIIGFVLLFLPYKLFFARLTFVWLYFLAATIKFHDGWVLGTYFTSLVTGLPIFGNLLAPISTNIVIASQVFGSWFLLSSKRILQTIAAGFFIFFHLYSGILVTYRYPTTALVFAIILFTVFKPGPFEPPLTRKSLPGWILLGILLLLQFIPVAIYGPDKLTLEGNYYALYMFEANHQCRSNATVHYANGTTRTEQKSSSDARVRCDPYGYWFTLKQMCLRDSSITSIEWTFDHSINGGPFYRIVDVPDACALSYKPFSHNDWIRIPSSGATIVGYPVKDLYY